MSILPVSNKSEDSEILFAGQRLPTSVNPYDQPGVGKYKKKILRVLEKIGFVEVE